MTGDEDNPVGRRLGAHCRGRENGLVSGVNINTTVAFGEHFKCIKISTL